MPLSGKGLGSPPVSRRAFARLALGSAAAARFAGRAQEPEKKASDVVLAQGRERREGLRRLLGHFQNLELAGRDVLLKASYGSSNPFPATTDPEMLEAVLGELRDRKSGRITLCERSGMTETRTAWERNGVPGLARRFEVELVALDELASERWRRERLEGSHWSRGVELPDLLTPESCVIQLAT